MRAYLRTTLVWASVLCAMSQGFSEAIAQQDREILPTHADLSYGPHERNVP